MDNLDRIDDSLKKKDGNRTVVLLAIPIVVALWFAFKDAISGRDQAEEKAAIELKEVNARHAKEIEALNDAWAIKYNGQVNARMSEKDSTIKKLQEKDEKYNELALQYFLDSRATRGKAERNNIKSKEVEKVINQPKR